jgi:phage-related protein
MDAQLVKSYPAPGGYVVSLQNCINEERITGVVGWGRTYVAQQGGKHQDAKPLKGFGSAGVVEIVKDYQGDTFRAVYTVRFAGVVYVLHVFQKKSKKGSKTPKTDVELIKKRLREAEQIARGEAP